MMGAIAGCLLLAVLALWGAGKFWGGDKPSKTVPMKEIASSKAAEKQVVPVTSPAIPIASPNQPSRGKPRVLFCVPHNGLFVEDFSEVMPTLSAGASVTIASTVGGRCNKYGGGVSQVTPQVVIGTDKISAQDYDAIIFAGANTGEFHYDSTAQLVSEFVNSGKLVTAICYGQEVLAHHKLLKPGVRVANSSYMTEKYNTTGCLPVNESVIRHENLITAQDPAAGPAFAKMILDSIQKKNP